MPDKPPNYLIPLAELARAVGSGDHEVTVAHDDWCALLKGTGDCNCNPEVRYGPPGHKAS